MEIAISALRHQCKLLFTLDRPRQGVVIPPQCVRQATLRAISWAVCTTSIAASATTHSFRLWMLCCASAKSLLLGFLIHCECDLCLTHNESHLALLAYRVAGGTGLSGLMPIFGC